jgi:hypothetical protein
MKKILSLIIAILIMSSVFSSCTKIKEDNTSSKVTDSDIDKTEIVESAVEEEQNILFTWKINLDGVDYILPFDFSELKANGFRLDKTDDWPLNGRSYSVDAVCPMIRGKFLRSLYWNPTDTPMKYSNCKIGQIEIDVKSRYKLILPGGLKFDINTTPQDVLDMYGDPYRLSEQDTYTEITYMQGEFSRVDFYFYTQDEKMKENNYVILQNFAG